jgi:hypothetical protein
MRPRGMSSSYSLASLFWEVEHLFWAAYVEKEVKRCVL